MNRPNRDQMAETDLVVDLGVPEPDLLFVRKILVPYYSRPLAQENLIQHTEMTPVSSLTISFRHPLAACGILLLDCFSSCIFTTLPFSSKQPGPGSRLEMSISGYSHRGCHLCNVVFRVAWISSGVKPSPASASGAGLIGAFMAVGISDWKNDWMEGN